MNTAKINPEVLFVAAQLCGIKAELANGQVWIEGDHDPDQDIMIGLFGEPIRLMYNPIENDAWARRLERALKKENWEFGFEGTAMLDEYWARGMCGPTLRDKSDSLLLLNCVAQMSGIPLYAP